MKCDNCHSESVRLTTAIIGGKFGNYCTNCTQKAGRSAHAGHAQYLRARDREDNAKDLLQPWNKDGTPNREFIREYPEEAKLNFTEKELKDFE